MLLANVITIKKFYPIPSYLSLKKLVRKLIEL